jgi:hypothetical protein
MLQEDVIAEKIECCRACQGQIEPLFSLGDQYIVDFPFLGEPQVKAPLELVKCHSCQLVQLAHTLRQDRLFKKFWYQSGISTTMVSSLKQIVDEAVSLVKLKQDDIVLDIGSNDGTLLRQYPEGPVLAGFEPAVNVAMKAQDIAHTVLNYFNAEEYRSIFGRRAKIITSIAMFYDLPDPNRFVRDVTKCLDPNGVWIIQMNYLPAMLTNNGYDNICHEHLEYYSLTTLTSLVQPYDLEVFRVQENDVNGGSFRVHIGFRGIHPVEHSVSQMLDSEYSQELSGKRAYADFQKRIIEETQKLRSFVTSRVREGKKVYVYGASTRGTVIIQYARLDRRVILRACDANPEKHGRVMVGSNIPIISKEKARKDKPDWWLLLPYHFLDEILKEEGPDNTYLIPLPKFREIHG